MPEITLTTVLQVVVGLGLLNVWLVRSSNRTPFRGGDAPSLRDEFAAYGLPGWFFYLTGALKIGSGVLLIAGLWVPSLILPAAGMVVALMVGALAMHVKVSDPLVKSLPALAMLAMSATVLGMGMG